MNDLDTAAAILADLTGHPVDDPAIRADAAIIAPRLATTDPETLRRQLIDEAAARVRAYAAAIRLIPATGEEGAAA